MSDCFKGYSGNPENLTEEQCTQLSNEGVTFNFKKGSLFGSTKSAKKGNEKFDVKQWADNQRKILEEGEKEQNRQASIAAHRAYMERQKGKDENKRSELDRNASLEKSSLEALGSFRTGVPVSSTDGTFYWKKCDNFYDKDCVPKRDLEQYENMSWKPCQDPTLKPCRKSFTTLNGVPIQKIRGGKKTRRKRKTKKYNIKK